MDICETIGLHVLADGTHIVFRTVGEGYNTCWACGFSWQPEPVWATTGPHLLHKGMGYVRILLLDTPSICPSCGGVGHERYIPCGDAYDRAFAAMARQVVVSSEVA